MDLIHFFGYTSQVVIGISLAPQVIKSWKIKSTKDISLTWTLTYFIGLFFLLLYAFGIQELPIIIGSSIEILLASFLIIAKLIYK